MSLWYVKSLSTTSSSPHNTYYYLYVVRGRGIEFQVYHAVNIDVIIYGEIVRIRISSGFPREIK